MLEANRATLSHGDSFDDCPDCQYAGGWHVVLLRDLKSRNGHDVKVLLRCPNCKKTYDLDLYCSVEHKGLTGA
jgi:uncharacterized C2H2 Zn-finger protein